MAVDLSALAYLHVAPDGNTRRWIVFTTRPCLLVRIPASESSGDLFCPYSGEKLVDVGDKMFIVVVVPSANPSSHSP